MRYYKIVVSDPVTGDIFVPNLNPLVSNGFTRQPATSGAVTFSSVANGVTLPGALLVEMDIPLYQFAQPAGQAMLRVWGIGLQQIAQASNLNNMNIAIFGGMSKGLPLANPKQAGLLVKGQIFQCFGNWQNTLQTLDFVFFPSTGSANSPLNFSFNWLAGMKLSDAIASTLKTVFPAVQQTININTGLVLSHDQPGIYQSLEQFARYLNDISKSILGGTYGGVRMTIRQDGISVYDGSSSSTPVQIQFQDMIGQATWIALATIQLQCVLRSDLQVGDFFTMPQGQVSIISESNPQARNSSAFQGTFQVSSIRHVGNSRDPSATSWVTVIEGYTVPSTSGSATTGSGAPVAFGGS